MIILSIVCLRILRMFKWFGAFKFCFDRLYITKQSFIEIRLFYYYCLKKIYN